MKWSEHLLDFYTRLQPPAKLPNDIAWLYPQKDPEVMKIVERFLNKYYEDENPRKIFLGINPGRFGAGVTGVNFTAPRQLKLYCGIDHPFKDQSELSAEFIYAMINAYGGAAAFYSHHFIGSVCPLGFVRQGKNLNYYDDRQLLDTVKPFIIKNIDRLTDSHYDRKKCFCIGGEKNFKFLKELNDQHRWFDQIMALPHPRFIMQYKRRYIGEFIQQYLQFIAE